MALQDLHLNSRYRSEGAGQHQATGWHFRQTTDLDHLLARQNNRRAVRRGLVGLAVTMYYPLLVPHGGLGPDFGFAACRIVVLDDDSSPYLLPSRVVEAGVKDEAQQR